MSYKINITLEFKTRPTKSEVEMTISYYLQKVM